MSKEIINQMDAALTETLQLLSSLNEEQINKIPFAGSWTAAQVVQHLYKSIKGMDELLYTPSQQADRNPEEKAQWLKDIFLNYENKMKSPDFILPEDKYYDQSELKDSLESAKDKMTEAAKNSKLEEMAPLPEGHPLNGITKLETLYFVTYHTIRHNHQMKNIRENLQ
ncbi:DinB family protein [Flavobacterium suzhouense]|uniref:DinB family protein n=1 Tax=Flavobacterium suzhouense TaxID=1529638 RepID=A0ABW5NTL0_9FLAO